MTTTLCTLCDSYVIKTGTYCAPCINWHGIPEIKTALMYNPDDNYDDNYDDDRDNEYKIMTSNDDENYEPYTICYGIEEAESVAKDAVSNCGFNYARILYQQKIHSSLSNRFEYNVSTSFHDYNYKLYRSCKTLEEALIVAKDAVSNGVFDYARIENTSGEMQFVVRENIWDRQDEARYEYEDELVRLAEDYELDLV